MPPTVSQRIKAGSISPSPKEKGKKVMRKMPATQKIRTPLDFYGKQVDAMNTKYAMVNQWLSSFQRNPCAAGAYDGTEQHRVGSMTFTSDGVPYSIPFTGLKRLIDTNEVECVNGSYLKDAIENDGQNHINKIPDNLEVLAKFLLEGAKLMRDVGVDKIRVCDEPLSDYDDNTGSGVETDD